MKKTISVLLVFILAVSLLAGCGGAGKSESAASNDYAPESPMAAPRPEPTEGEAWDKDNGADMYGLTEETVAEEGESALGGGEFGLKIIYTYDFNVETREFEESARALTAAAKAAGGYVERSSQEGGYHGYSNQYYSPRYAYYTFRIPADRVDGFVNSLEAVGNVTYRNEYTDDITSAYIDTEARLKSLKTQEERLLVLLEKAEDIETLLKIERSLADVRYQIENYESQIKTFDALVAYSTVSVSLSEVREAAPKAKDNFGQRVADAFKGSLAGVVEFFKGLVIFLIYALPVFIILGLIAFFIAKPIIKKHKAKNLEREAQYLANAKKADVEKEKKTIK